MDERRLEEEYRKMQRQAAPDLWGRIESSLKDHPERMEKGAAGAEPEKIAAGALGETREAGEAEGKIRRLPKRTSYRIAAAAAAAVALLVAAPQMLNRWPGYGTANSGAGGMDTAMSERTLEMDAAAQAAPETAVEEEMAVAEAVEEDTLDSGSVPDMAPVEIEEIPNFAAPEYGNGFLQYDQLQLVSYQPLAVPANAVTVPEDSQYFSEAIFRDTELLVGGTVTDVSLEYDGDGKAVKVVYEMNLDQVYYAEDYTTGLETLTLKSPIVETEGDEVFILYQLQPGGTYLLPLWQKDGDWELLYPFAPQIQVTGDGGYLFHSGYASLVTGDTSVVLGSQEGENDYYYDRMLLREDGNFLSDFVSLVESQVQGGNQNEKE